MRGFPVQVLPALLVTASVAAAQAPPTIADFTRALEASLLKLRPMGYTERQVLFSNVRQGRGNGASWPFEADVVIRDYGPGYPPNGYYGDTCIGRLNAARFNLVQDDFGGWAAQGALTPRDRECKANPAKDVSSVPLASLSGSPAAAASGRPAAAAPAGLPLGEYACYGRGGIVLAGMGFRLGADGRYTDVEGAGAGRYRLDAAAARVAFDGGHLGGQSAQRDGAGIRFSNMVSCEPWRR